jgi:hypothetical protein
LPRASLLSRFNAWQKAANITCSWLIAKFKLPLSRPAQQDLDSCSLFGGGMVIIAKRYSDWIYS